MTELTPIRRGRCAGAGNWQTQYQALQMTAREAAELIRDGDMAAKAAVSPSRISSAASRAVICRA